jgi:hypothetical protein
MGYWYIKAKISHMTKKEGLFTNSKWSKPCLVEGKVIGIGNTGFYGSHACYMVVSREGKDPIVEAVLVNSDATGDCKHQILELTYRSK